MTLPQWVVTDLDETLLHHDRTISHKSLMTIRKVRELGCRFAIATTRSPDYAKPWIEMLKPDAMVLSGGAVAYMGDERHYHMPLDKQLLDKILQELPRGTHKRPWVLDTSAGRFGNGESLASHMVHEIYSMFLWIEEDHAQALSETWKSSVVLTALWEPDMYRLSHPKATKHHALQGLLRNVDPKAVVCFGDDLMDVGMLDHFFGVAVENARSEAKLAATHQTLSNEADGVALWLERHILANMDQSGNRLV